MFLAVLSLRQQYASYITPLDEVYDRKQIHRGANSPYIQKAGEIPSLGQNGHHLSFGSTLESVLLNTSYCTVLMIEIIRGLLPHTAPSAAGCALFLPISC